MSARYITYKLRSSNHMSSVPLKESSVRGRDLRQLVATKMSTTSEEIEIFNSLGNPIHPDDDIPANSFVEVVRRAASSTARAMTAAQRAAKEATKDIKHVIGAGGNITSFGPRGRPFFNSGGVPPATKPEGGADAAGDNLNESEKLTRMQQQIASETGVDGASMRAPRSFGGGAGSMEDRRRAPPPGYICHNCGEGGHFIQHCPHAKGSVSQRQKLLSAPVGIAESMLVECGPDDPAPKFVTRDGKLVKRRQDRSAFTGLLVSSAGGVSSGKNVEVPPHLLCVLCGDVLSDAMRLPCCEAFVCDDCLEKHIQSEIDSINGDSANFPEDSAAMDDEIKGNERVVQCPACRQQLENDAVEPAQEIRDEITALRKRRRE